MINLLIRVITIGTFYCITKFALAQDKVMTIDLDKIPTVAIKPTHVINDNGEPLFSNFAKITYDYFENKIYLADLDQILVLSKDGKITSKFGRRGKGPGEFIWISKIEFNENYIFVADKQNPRVQIFDKNFSYLRSIPVNKPINDMTYLGNNQIIIHTFASMGYILHKYDIESPFKPVESYLRVISKHDKIPGNILTINQVNIVSNKDCIYVLYIALPIMKIFCKNTKHYKEFHFMGKEVNNLYDKLPTSVKTSSGAVPVKQFTPKILIGSDSQIYWLCTSIKPKKIFVFDSSLQSGKAYVLEIPENKHNQQYSDFCVVNNSIYVSDVSSGGIQVYKIDHSILK